MKKQLIAAGLAGMMALALTSCSGGGTTTPSGSAPASGGTCTTGACQQVKDTNGDGLIEVGVAQVGAESGWRSANTQSYKDAFTEANGFKLTFVDAGGDSDKQKQQFRDFISQGMEVIVLDPVVSAGWETVLQEAIDAGIPVINADRQLDCDHSLYLAFLGSDMLKEGQGAVDWLKTYVAANPDQFTDGVNIAHLQGTMGASAQVGRSQALADGITANGWNLVWEQSGDFNQQTGQTVFQSFLQQKTPFNVLYSENDDMTYGAIDAMTASGLDPKDYVIISFDGNAKAIQMVIDGTIDIISQCNPMIGPQIAQLIKDSAAGKTIPADSISTEHVITTDTAAADLPNGF